MILAMRGESARKKSWSRRGSNPRPEAHKTSALDRLSYGASPGVHNPRDVYGMPASISIFLRYKKALLLRLCDGKFTIHPNMIFFF